MLYPVTFLVCPPPGSAFPEFEGGALRQCLCSNALALALCLTTLLKSDGYPVTYTADKGPFAGTLKPLFEVSDLLVKVEVK